MSQPYESLNLVATTTGAKTASFNSEFFKYVDYTVNSCVIYIDVTAVSGTTPTLTAQLQSLDPASGKWINITGAVTTTINSISTVTLSIWQWLTAVANSVVNAVLPNTLRLAYTIGWTTPSFTFTAGVTFTP